MNIPDSFKKKIKSTFYDKTINRHGVTSTKDGEGWTRDGQLTSNGSYLGNTKFSNFDEVKQAYGIDQQIAMIVTTDQNIPLGEINSYNGNYYRVIKSIPFDSHYMLVLEEWSSKS